MKIPKFRFKFQASQKTDFSNPIIVEKILAKLKDKKYIILGVTDNTITFERNPFRLVWNFQAPYILDEGDFKITKSEQGTIVVLNYFFNILYLIAISTAFVVFCIINGLFFGALFFGLFYLIAGVFQYNTTKNVGEELLNDILTEDS
jgi:hypothetical protein